MTDIKLEIHNGKLGSKAKFTEKDVMTGVGAQAALPPTTEIGRKINQLISCGRDDSQFQMTIVSILLYLLQQEEAREKSEDETREARELLKIGELVAIGPTRYGRITSFENYGMTDCAMVDVFEHVSELRMDIRDLMRLKGEE